MPQPQQRGIRAPFAPHTPAPRNPRSLTPWMRPGIELTTSWFLMGFVNHWAMIGTPGDLFKHSGIRVHHRPIKSGWGKGELNIYILQSTPVDSDMKSRLSVTSLEQWFSMWSPQNRSISISQKLVRNTDSWAPLQTCRMRNSGDDTQQSAFEQALQRIPLHTKVWALLP